MKPPRPPGVIGTKIAGAVVDSKTAALVNAPITLKFFTDSGAPATFVRDNKGKALTSLTVKDGLVNLTIADGTSFPVDLVVTATGKGYLPTSATVPLTGPGNYKLVEEIASTANPPTGVVIPPPIAAGSANSSGTTTTTTTVATPDAPSAMNLTLGAGTTLTDLLGKPLHGTLSAVVAAYDSQSPLAMEAVPGSLSNALVDQGSGNTSTGAIVVGGFSQIFVTDSSGTSAKNFSQPMPATMQLPDITVNPLTGATLQPGDSAPLYSFDEGTGLWKSEGTAAINTSTVTGSLNADFNVTHLSGWAIAWFVSPAQQCTLDLQINGAGNNALTLVASAVGYEDRIDVPAGTTSLEITGIAPSISATIAAYYAGTKVGTVTVNDCVLSGPLNVTIPSSIVPTTLDVLVYDVCSNDNKKKTPVPSANVAVTTGNVGELPQLGVTDTTGTAHITGLTAGENVTVYAENRNGPAFEPQTRTLQATNPPVEFDNIIACTKQTGAGGGSP